MRRRRSAKEEDERDDRAYSPLTRQTGGVKNTVPGQGVDDDDDLDEEDLSPAVRGNGATSYFVPQHENFEEEEDEREEGEEGEDDEDAVNTPLLPIFSAAHLDRLPLYNITHAIRLLIVQRAETTLSWDQLRSPQISQFLIKPIQNQVRSNHFNRATLCALIANCLQFQKEAQMNPGNVGISKTRALISELLAMRLVKEFTTRELIDALSYDFDPLQGLSAPGTGVNPSGAANPGHQDLQTRRVQARAARVSTIEVAIRAQAKRFLAHPLVVQHLEAIWAGTVVFHFEADNLHRKPERRTQDKRGGAGGYGTITPHAPSALPAEDVLSRKAISPAVGQRAIEAGPGRREVTLYDPREASLFKLSRLRVPRYRQVFSTISFAIMLGLFIAVLVDRSLYITPLEIVFWIWSAGYMLDEVVGFTEQGFGLYIMSFWNAFDLGILALFVIYYCLRLYGVLLADQGKHRIASMAYDVLASTAVLLFPRLFSVLDHYRYFSQLLIAFRMMAQDLVAILILILISCSGFFVAFTLSFSDDNTDGVAVAYALFQILMGFTPAAWEKWHGYNMLGKAIMTMFLIICHFLIVTILITVLTNSFMAIVQNANEEHQFLFAVNTISMVKSDALFSYIAPTNVLSWLLSPLRYIIPFRQYVKVNRTVIKITHFPVLAVVFAYERVILSRLAYDSTDLIEKTARSQSKPLAFSFNKAPEVFSPGRRLREPSVISFHKDRALDEVFRRPFRGSTLRTTTREMDPERRNSTNVVDTWMRAAEEEGGASPPIEQPRSVLDRLETRRPGARRALTSDRHKQKILRDFSPTTKSLGSDPDMHSLAPSRRPARIVEEDEPADISMETLPQETGDEGDDENNVESDHQITPAIGESAVSIADKENRTPGGEDSDEEYFQTPTAGKSPYVQMSTAARARLQDTTDLGSASNMPPRTQSFQQTHARNISTGTTVFAPTGDESSAKRPIRMSRPGTARNTNSGGTTTPVAALTLASGTRTPRMKPTRARPIMPPRQQTAPIAAAGVSFFDVGRQQGARRQPSFNARALDLASEIGDNKWGPSGIDVGGISGMPASFSEQLLRERELERMREDERRRGEAEEKGMVNRIMLARMHTLEEGFREVLREIKDMSHAAGTGSSRRESEADFSARGGGIKALRPKSQEVIAPPLTPLGRVAGMGEGMKRKSPRKLQRRNTGKGKEVERGGSSLKMTREEGASPESGASGGRRGEQAEGAAERPGTALWSPLVSKGDDE
ncbi:hypothetical protein LTR62_005954 [Meristemomyces frigidus]|uniref:Ion transport domain-containing protein n=1 Tax=Meristemomyces frigidus TaxID=1508187 RepID=A0AAN7YMT5_9PEZI|nr:hypothetical protein LTR62_005954 [Meristemomyces frigidus]